MSGASMHRYQASCLLADADVATLSNVRERCHSAAEAWIRMAERIERTDARGLMLLGTDCDILIDR